MKKSLLITLMFTFIVSATYSQLRLGNTGWKVKSFGISNGVDQDMIHDLSHTQMMGLIRGGSKYDYHNINFTEQDVYSMYCENPNVRLSVAIAPEGSKHSELHLSLVGIFNRIEGVNYWKDNAYLNFDSHGNELALEAKYNHRINLLPFLHLGLAGGLNHGWSYGNRITITGHNVVTTLSERSGPEPNDPVTLQYIHDEYEMKNATYNRAFGEISLGVSFFHRIELGFGIRKGAGFRNTPGAGSNTLTHHSSSFSLRYLLR